MERDSDSTDIRSRTIEALIAGSGATESLRFRDPLQHADGKNQAAASGTNAALRGETVAKGGAIGALLCTNNAPAPVAHRRPLERLAGTVFICIFMLGAFLAGVYIVVTSGDWHKTAQLPVATAILRPAGNTEDHVDAASRAPVSQPISPKQSSHSMLPDIDTAAGLLATRQKAGDRFKSKLATPPLKAPNPMEQPKQPLATANTRRVVPQSQRPSQMAVHLVAPLAVTKPAGSEPVRDVPNSPIAALSNVKPPAAVPVTKASKPADRLEKALASANATLGSGTAKNASQLHSNLEKPSPASRPPVPNATAEQPIASTSVSNASAASKKTSQPPLQTTPSVSPPSVAVNDAAGPTLSTKERKTFVSRGDALFAAHDLTSARLFYQYGAEAGDGAAAVRLGETYDPVFLGQAHLGAVLGDANKAAYWYRWARGLGSRDAEILLKNLQSTRN